MVPGDAELVCAARALRVSEALARSEPERDGDDVHALACAVIAAELIDEDDEAVAAQGPDGMGRFLRGQLRKLGLPAGEAGAALLSVLLEDTDEE